MRYLLFLFCLLPAADLAAQTAEDSVTSVVKLLFSAMKDADTTALQQVFAEGAILQTIQTQAGNTRTETESVRDFAASIGKVSKGDADERITLETVKTAGELAVVWAPYRFYRKGKLSHCGVDSFQLVRIGGVWKIQYLIDTRHKEDCR